MKSGVYKIQCIFNNKLYIGSSKNIGNRITNHLRDLKNNTHKNFYLQKDYIDYGIKNFDFNIIEYCQNYNEKEQYYINLLNPEYNICKEHNTKKGVLLSEKRKFLKQEEFKFYQTDFKGNILNEFWTISEAEKELKIRGTAISKILKNGNYCKLGYFLSYDISKLPLKVPKNYAGNKTIIQYDSNFNKINEFNSPKEIEALTDVSYKAVFSAIERKGKAGGFYWQYLNNNK